MYVYGASGHARAVLDIIDSQEIIHGIFDDNPQIEEVLGYPVLGKIPLDFQYDQSFFIAIGDNKVRKRIADRLCKKVGFATIIHESAIFSAKASIEAGGVVMEGAIVKVNSRIGKQVIINTGASVDHDCIFGDFVHLAPQATLCGEISIGEGTLVGANALVLPRVKIGNWCTIGAGSIVNKDVADKETWIGTGVGKPYR